MIVCVCRKVSDRQIRQAVADGAHSLDCLEFELGVASQCGRCADCASRVLCEARHAANVHPHQHPHAHPHQHQHAPSHHPVRLPMVHVVHRVAQQASA